MRKDENKIGPAPAEGLSGDLLELLLDQADRALLMVDARTDIPGQREAAGFAPEEPVLSQEVADLSCAVAEIADEYPNLPMDLENVEHRLRTEGIARAAAEFEAHGPLLDVVRLSLEGLVRTCPDLPSYIDWLPGEYMGYDLKPSDQTYEMLQRGLDMLRERLN